MQEGRVGSWASRILSVSVVVVFEVLAVPTDQCVYSCNIAARNSFYKTLAFLNGQDGCWGFLWLDGCCWWWVTLYWIVGVLKYGVGDLLNDFL